MKRKTLLLLIGIIFASILAACGNSDEAAGGGADTFYEGETLEILIPFSAGGGTDSLFRYFQDYLNEYVDGNPSIQVENVPGGGSVIGANEYVDLREPDGLTALATSASTKIPFLIGQTEVTYDLRELQPIVGMPNGVVLYTSPDSGVTNGAELLDPPQEMVLGATSPTGIDVMTLLAFEVLGIDDQVEIIFGYEGAGASRQAFEQGETNLDYQSGTSYQSNVQPLVDDGEAVPLFTYGFINAEGEIVADPAFPDIPTVKDVYVEVYGEEPSGEAWEAYKAFVGVANGMHKTLWLHGDAPESAVQALREGVESAVADEDFKKGADEVLGNYDPLVGEDLEASVDALASIEDETLQWVSDFLREEYNVEGLRE
ncbi:Tripartite-type tricarboxylate transporter, receptor component TctC [Lentibacillus halodurans]|uniref:Tripartite-type tricarboxylate transporter, receptor component TctC n=1 Tax=Lentibacillus halodurans TaxID=237679 RepID=A0A1I0XM88_9BACI|nr:tripartite tricarboxylate transporter substrate-binding protein [Lentibacillus halodurans]SFB01420.1 Tripartite-type tricarboxylate transporter, receptor component TctC [Lentibacillus halodurans]